MFSFLRAQTFQDPLLGRFKRVRTMWYPEHPRAGLNVSMEGGRDGPSQEVVQVARRLLEQPEALVQTASAFLRADGPALDFMQGNGELVCDGFTVYQSGDFTVEFSLSEWPDAMISVSYKEGAPCEVVLGD